MTILRAISFGTRNVNTQFYTNFPVFKFFENFCHFLSFSALDVKQRPQGFYNRLMHSF